MPGREYELGDLARLPRILYEAFQERRSVDIRNKPRHETPTIQQTSNSKPSVSTPYSRTLPALPRPRYCIGLVGTEQEKQALQKERLTKFMIQQATGRRFVPEVLKGAGAFCRSIATRKIGCSESTFMALLHFAVLLRARVLVPLAMLVDRFMRG